MLLFLTVIIIILIIGLKVRNRKYERLRKIFSHDLPSIPILGITYLAIGSNERIMQFIQMIGREGNRKGGLICDWFGPSLFLVISDAEIARLLTTKCLEKDNLFKKMGSLLIGNGIFTAPVPEWRTRRKILVPTFNTRNLNRFVHVFSKQSYIMVQRLRSKANAQPFAVWSYFAYNNMDSVCETVMGVQLKAQEKPEQPFLTSFLEAFHLTASRIFQPWLYADFIYKLFPASRQHEKARNIMYGFVSDLIISKRKEIQENQTRNSQTGEPQMKTFLDMLIASSEEERGYTNEELSDEIMALMLASTDTSANAAAFTLIMLSRYPDIQEKVFKELKEVFGNEKGPIVPEDLPRLKYMDIVIKETLRLYPPAPLIIRQVSEDVMLPSGVTIPAGCGILLNIWAVHRNSTYWGEDVEEFRPERFLDTPFKHPAQYMPFSFGPRSCPGYSYAMMSMKTLLAMTLREYRVLPATSPNESNQYPPLRLTFELLMKDADGFKICLEPRQ
ncbi:cytochrome P450 4V2-like [Pectinophora gossypiella]|uniref:cytochrome P450 4V2-like n=1 Tax=Pectinophora gossypiella TaxID=13191 RepID=UPI00214EDA8B|nr:cytochrome P450 4V2-like [Pectinophora gossypiella]